MDILAELNTHRRSIADLLEQHGWQDAVQNAEGAIMYYPSQDGDRHILRAVQRHRDQGNWDDLYGSTIAEATATLRDDLTETELVVVLGPQWADIAALVRRAANLTGLEQRRLSDMWEPVELTVEALEAVRRFSAAGTAAACTTPWGYDSPQAAAASRDAAEALAIRHVRGGPLFTRADYRNLTSPWLVVIGPAHPDD